MTAVPAAHPRGRSLLRGAVLAKVAELRGRHLLAGLEAFAEVGPVVETAFVAHLQHRQLGFGQQPACVPDADLVHEVYVPLARSPLEVVAKRRLAQVHQVGYLRQGDLALVVGLGKLESPCPLRLPTGKLKWGTPYPAVPPQVSYPCPSTAYAFTIRT